MRAGSPAGFGDAPTQTRAAPDLVPGGNLVAGLGGLAGLPGRAWADLPVEVFTLDPELVHQYGELAGECRAGLLGADALLQLQGPGFQGAGFLEDGDDDVGTFVEQVAHEAVAAMGDVAFVVGLAGLPAPGREAEIGADIGGSGEACRVVDDGGEGLGGDGADAGPSAFS